MIPDKQVIEYIGSALLDLRRIASSLEKISSASPKAPEGSMIIDSDTIESIKLVLALSVSLQDGNRLTNEEALSLRSNVTNVIQWFRKNLQGQG